MNKPVLRSTQMKNVNSLLSSTFGATTTSIIIPNDNDYRDQDLTGKNFRDQDLTDALFTDADLTDVDFTGANLTGAVLRTATIIRTNFTNATLVFTAFTGANTRVVQDLTGKNTGAIFRGAELVGADFTGANLTGADFTDAKNPKAAFFRDADLTDAIGLPP